MELTNYSFLQSRNQFLNSIADRKVAADRVATGKRLVGTGLDVGAISSSSYHRTEMLSDRQSIINLQNLRSFLYAQENSLKRVHEMYDRMEILAIKAANPITKEEDRMDYEIEYSAYRKQLDEIMKSRYNGKLLFSSTEMCGGPTNVTLKELDASTPDKKNAGNGTHIVRAQTQETGSPSGTVSFRVNSGTAGDTYRVWMGDVCVFSAGPRFNGSTNDLYEQLDNGDYKGKNYNSNTPFAPTGRYGSASEYSYTYNKTNDDGTTEVVTIETENPTFAYPGNGWKTSGAATNGDDDLFTVTFGPGEKTTYTIGLGASNDRNGDGISDEQSGDYDAATQTYPNTIFTKDLPTDFDRTEMTLQVETTSIGVIYEDGKSSGRGETEVQETDAGGNLVFNSDGSPKMVSVDQIANDGVKFTPSPFIRYIPKDRHGNNIELDPKGFDRFEKNTLLTPASAQEAADRMRGNANHFGEMKCIVENRIGILGSEYKRVDSEIRALEDQIMSGEVALSRIRDADMAKEATSLASNSLRSEMASQVMNNSSRLKNVLISLTTQHHRGSIMSAGLS